MEYIRQVDLQIRYLRLIKEDQWNPWMDLVRNWILADDTRDLIPASQQFYLENYMYRK